jgi:hypothetical protein
LAHTRPVSFEVSRIVESGMDDFMKVVDDIATRAIPPDFSEAYIREDGLVGRRRIDLYNKLQIPLVQFGAPTGKNYYSTFQSVSARLFKEASSDEDGETKYVHPLHQRLAAAKVKYDIPPNRPIPIVCRGLIRTDAPNKNGSEFLLLPDQSNEATANALALFDEETDILFSAIQSLGRMSGKLDFRQRAVKGIPIGAVNGDVRPSEVADFLGRMRRHDPDMTVRVLVGPMLKPLVRE